MHTKRLFLECKHFLAKVLNWSDSEYFCENFEHFFTFLDQNVTDNLIYSRSVAPRNGQRFIILPCTLDCFDLIILVELWLIMPSKGR